MHPTCGGVTLRSSLLSEDEPGLVGVLSEDRSGSEARGVMYRSSWSDARLSADEGLLSVVPHGATSFAAVSTIGPVEGFGLDIQG